MKRCQLVSSLVRTAVLPSGIGWLVVLSACETVTIGREPANFEAGSSVPEATKSDSGDDVAPASDDGSDDDDDDDDTSSQVESDATVSAEDGAVGAVVEDASGDAAGAVEAGNDASMDDDGDDVGEDGEDGGGYQPPVDAALR